jgi:hypothetical protein
MMVDTMAIKFEVENAEWVDINALRVILNGKSGRGLPAYAKRTAIWVPRAAVFNVQNENSQSQGLSAKLLKHCDKFNSVCMRLVVVAKAFDVRS